MSDATRPRRTKRVTITQVAKEAGVSPAAVSRILNNNYEGFSAREETKARVHAAVQKLDYKPSRSAVRLATGRQNALALCYPSYGEERPIDTTTLTTIFRQFDHMLAIHGVSRLAARHRLDLVLSPRSSQRPLADLLAQARESVDGIIYIQPEEDAEARELLLGCELPIAIVGSATAVEPRFCNVRVDEVTAGRMAMGHLLVKGCRRIVLAVPEAQARETALAQRLEGARVAARQFNDPGLGMDVLRLPPDDGGADSILRAHIAKWGRPDGILTLGGHLPFVVLKTLEREKLDVPEDLRLVGFDENPTYQLNSPTITGIRYPVEEMCFRAAEMLHERITTGKVPDPVVMSPAMMARASSGR